MTVKEIETAISQLAPKDLVELTAWLVDFHHRAWDQQIEDDLEAGRLDAVLAQVDQDIGSTARTIL